ncbi:MAG: dienelactone hydrolase family protein [Chloroflexi bacterium]|nr:dienelactone hydrolase family protein [Chloroflexota bacterium]
MITYEARPKNASGVLPVVMVCHENMGLTDHIRDVARRYAKQGYLASALDLLSRQGGTAKVTDTSKIPSLLSATDALTQEVGDFKALAQYYAGQGAKAIGMNGFCFGGGIVWRSTEELGDMLKAAVPFYGAPPPLDQVSKIKAAVYGVYSADPQDFANNNRDQLFAALKAANVTADFKAYPGTRHAFNNDTGQAYNQEQALAAWQDTLNWFAKYLKA